MAAIESELAAPLFLHFVRFMRNGHRDRRGQGGGCFHIVVVIPSRGVVVEHLIRERERREGSGG